jgi:peroxiredoxin
MFGLFLYGMLPYTLQAQSPANVPAFQLATFEGASFTEKNLPNNQMVFFCFFDITCDHCRHAITSINKEHSKFGKTALYLVSLDNKQGVYNFLNKYGPILLTKKNVTLLHDAQNEFIYKFKPKKYPAMYLYSVQKSLVLYADDEKSIPLFLKKIQPAAK